LALQTENKKSTKLSTQNPGIVNVAVQQLCNNNRKTKLSS